MGEPMLDEFNLQLRAPVASAVDTRLQFSHVPSSVFAWDDDTCEDGGVTLRREGSSSRSSMHGSGDDRHDVQTTSRSLFIPVSSLVNEEEAVLVEPVLLSAEEDKVEVPEAAPWNPEEESHWLQEEYENSQRSATSCRTQTMMTTTMMMMRVGDPGAPKKSRLYGHVCNDADELSVTCGRPTMYQNIGGMHGGSSSNNNNNNISIACESSIPSHITPLEELGESVDLTNHISHLIVSASPTHKRLLFVNALEDCGGDSAKGYDGRNCIGRGMQVLHRGKRFLDELDANRDVASVSSTPSKATTESRWKYRRMDNSGGGNIEGW